MKITVNDNGPYLLDACEIVDGAGNAIDTAEKPKLALCRCGQSANKPFCDGAHKAAGFESVVRAK